MHALNTTIEVERLYIELGECIQANDQEGVQRIFAALVRAKRPLTEIVGEVKRLSRAGVRSEAEPEPSVTDEWPQPGIAPQPVEPAPQPTPQPTYANFAGAGMPPASPLSPDSAATWASESDAPVLRQWPPGDATSEAVPSNAEAELRSVDPAMSFDLPDHPEIAAAPAISDVEPASSWQDEWARPEALPDPEQSIAEPEQSTPAPIHQLFEPAIELETAGQAVTAAIVEEDPAASPGPATQQNPPAELEQGAPDTAPQISGRAIALGVGLDSSEGADTTQSKRASGPLAGRLAVALAIITVLAGTAAFLLVKPAGEQAADKAIPSVVATAAPAPKPAPSEAQIAVTPASGGPSERTAGLAATALLPAATAPSPQPAAAAGTIPGSPAAVVPDSPAIAKPGNSATLLPDSPAAAKPGARPSIASLEPPGGVTPKTPAGAETPAPAAKPAATPPVEASPPAQPRSSSLETAPLLERGDRLFGMGDVTSARLFYERAADAGDGQAALRLGETFDPHFLERAKLRSVQGDPTAAVFWYRRARELGVAEAEILLKSIQTKEERRSNEPFESVYRDGVCGPPCGPSPSVRHRCRAAGCGNQPWGRRA